MDLGDWVYGIYLSPGVSISDRQTMIVTVPAGFDTDFSSVPGWALSLMGEYDRHDLAGVIHDWLYRVRAPREAADRVWWIVARSGLRRVGPVRGWMGWVGLRLGGRLAYRSHSTGGSDRGS